MDENKWTEERILSYEEESFYYERKGGKLFETGGIKDDLAKEVCSFANSEGGVIALGVDDNGSFSGIDEYKGNKTTKEWLGNILKNTLAPQFQRFHVRSVTPSEPTSIPEGKVLLVIEVEKSEIAPHQVIHNGVYFHRVDKESLPASHSYIQGLFARQTFPGPNVGNAWIQSVINPAITTLEDEQRRIRIKDWGSNSPSRTSLNCFRYLDTSKDRPNVEQFFIEHKEIHSLVIEHDRRGEALVEIAKEKFWEVERLALADGFFERFTSQERMTNLKTDPNANINRIFDQCNDRADFLEVLRMEDDAKLYTKHFIGYLFEGRSPMSDNKSGPMWQANGDAYRAIFQNAFEEQLIILDKFAEKLSNVIDILIGLFRNERDLLCRKYGLPYDPLEITNIPFPRNGW